MAGNSKVGWAKLKVGLLAIAALIIVFFLVYLMAGSQGLFASKSTLYTYLRDSHSLAQGAPVTLNGVGIDGKIAKVELTGLPDPSQTVRIVMEVGTKYLDSIPSDSQTEMASANLLGTYYINIIRGKSSQPVKAEATLSSTETAEISDLFRQSSQTLAAFQVVVKQVSDIVSDIQNGKGSIGKILVDDTLVNNFIDIETQFKQLASDLHNTMTSDNNSVGKLLNDKGALYDNVHDIIARSSKLVDDIDNGKGSLGQFIQNPAVHDQTVQILSDTHQLLAGINSGEGTLGKLVKSTELSDQVKSTLGRVDTLLDKMSNGNGSFARLLNDPTLVEDLDSLTRESQGLIKDFRTNPKKFLHIKIGLF